MKWQKHMGNSSFIARNEENLDVQNPDDSKKHRAPEKAILSPGWLFFRVSILLSCLAAVSQRQLHIRPERAQPTWLVTMVVSHWTTN